MKTRKEIWEFIKEHKTEIIVSASTLVVGVVIGYKLYNKKTQPDLTINLMGIKEPESLLSDDALERLFERSSKSSKYDNSLGNLFNQRKALDIKDLGIGELTMTEVYDNGHVELMIDKLSINDIGKVGEVIAEKFPDIPENPNVWALIAVKPNE